MIRAYIYHHPTTGHRTKDPRITVRSSKFELESKFEVIHGMSCRSSFRVAIVL